MPLHITTVADTAKPTDDKAILEAARIFKDALRTFKLHHFVEKVLERAGATPIDSLRIFGHAGAGQQTIGGDAEDIGNHEHTLMIVAGTLNRLDLLKKLSGRFARNAVVELHGCHAGEGLAGRRLALALARLWGVTVRAAFNDQRPDARSAFEGPYVEVGPAGVTVERHGTFRRIFFVPREDIATHTVGREITRADWLSSLAGKHYGEVLFWPLIWERNKAIDPLFKDPNRMRPHQVVKIPVKPAMTPDEERILRFKGRSWQAY